MKKLIMTALLSGLIYSIGVCQGPTLSNYNYVPKINQKIETFMADTIGVRFNDTGENFLWDYSSLKVSTTKGAAFFVDPETTPYKSSFKNATVANEAADYFDYYCADNRNISVLGNVSPFSIMVYTKPIMLLNFPFSYGNQFTDDFYGTYTLYNKEHTKSGNQTVSADGWGTLKLPKNTYSNVLRLKTTLNIIDSATGEKTEYFITKYSWYDGINNFPLLEATSAIINFKGNPTTKINKSIFVAALTQIVSVPSLINSASVTIYPNPISDQLNIESSEGITNIRICSLLGQTMFERSFNDYSKVQKIYLLNLSSGSYLVEIDNFQGQKICKRLVKK